MLRSSRRRYLAYRDEIKKRRHDPQSAVDHSSHGSSGHGSAHGSLADKPRKPRSRPFLQLLRDFVKLLVGHRATLALVAAIVGISTLMGLTPYYGTKIVVDSVLREPPLPLETPSWIPLPTDRRQLLTAVAVGMVVLATCRNC